MLSCNSFNSFLLPSHLLPSARREKRGKSAKPEGVEEATVASKEAKTKTSEEQDSGDTVEDAPKEVSFDDLLAQHRAQQLKAKEVVTNGNNEQVVTGNKVASIEARVKKVARKDLKKSSFPLSSAAEVKSRKKAGEECLRVQEINKRLCNELSKETDKDTESAATKVTPDDVADTLSKLSLSEDSLHLSLFTNSRPDTLALLEAEMAALGEDQELASQLALWSGGALNIWFVEQWLCLVYRAVVVSTL